MKTKNTFLLTLSLLFTIAFSSCDAPVFYYVNQDVASEEATVSGIINSIARYTIGDEEYLFLWANNGLRYKKAENDSHGEWKTYDVSKRIPMHHYDYYGSSNHEGYQVVKVLSDAEALFLVAVSYENYQDEGISIPKKCHIFALKIEQPSENDNWKENWKESSKDLDEKMYLYMFENRAYSAFSVFGTNSINKANRKVYLRSGDSNAKKSDFETLKYYELTYSNIDSLDSPNIAEPELEEKNYSSAIYAGSGNFKNAGKKVGDVIFFEDIAVCSDEEKGSSEPNTIYWGAGKNLHYQKKTGEVEDTLVLNAGETISCIAVCSDAVLIGRGNFNNQYGSGIGGLVKTSIDSTGKPDKSLVSFSTNADVQLPTAYYILTLLNTDCTKTELESSIYSSIYFGNTGSSTTADFKKVGLWSYYPSRGNWNRE